MIMLLSVHVTSVLFLVQFSIFAYGFRMELHALTLVTCSYTLLLLHNTSFAAERVSKNFLSWCVEQNVLNIARLH